MKSAVKPPNGMATCNAYKLTFDPDDENQVKARAVAQQLAGQRKLKQALIGLLLAVHTVQEKTGRQIDLTEFMASFITGLVVGGSALPARVEITPATTPDELPTIFAGTDNHVDPLEARQTFSAGLGHLFDEDEDIWEI